MTEIDEFLGNSSIKIIHFRIVKEYDEMKCRQRKANLLLLFLLVLEYFVDGYQSS